MKQFKTIILLCLLTFFSVQKNEAQDVQVIPNDGLGSYTDLPVVLRDKICIRVKNPAGAYQLGVWDGSGAVRVIPNPDDSKTGYIGYPILFQDKLYIEYQTSRGVYQLGQFDGSLLTLIPNPDSTPAGYVCTGNEKPLVCNGTLYLPYLTHQWVMGKFDGTRLSLVSLQDDNGRAQYWSPAVYNGKLILPYTSKSGVGNLAEYNGAGFTLIPYPERTANSSPYQGSPVVYNGTLYFCYVDLSGTSHLAGYNGSSVSIIPNPPGKEYSTLNQRGIYPSVCNNKLYLFYNEQLAEFDGTTLRLLADCPFTPAELPIGYNGKLYGPVYSLHGVEKPRLAMYDGTSAQMIDAPAGSEDWQNFDRFYFVFEGKLYLSYGGKLATYDGSKISLLGDYYNPVVFNDKLYFGVMYPHQHITLTYEDTGHLAYFDTHPLHPEPGDLVVYWDENANSYVHVGVVKHVKEGTDVIDTIRSKWGSGAVYDSDPAYVPSSYGRDWSIWRRIGNRKVISFDNVNRLDSKVVTVLGCVAPPLSWFDYKTDKSREIIKEPFYAVETDVHNEDIVIVDAHAAKKVVDDYPVNYSSYDCRGFVFGDRTYRIVDFKTNYLNCDIQPRSQVQWIILDGYQPIPAHDTQGNTHYWSLNEVRIHPKL